MLIHFKSFVMNGLLEICKMGVRYPLSDNKHQEIILSSFTGVPPWHMELSIRERRAPRSAVLVLFCLKSK